MRWVIDRNVWTELGWSGRRQACKVAGLTGCGKEGVNILHLVNTLVDGAGLGAEGGRSLRIDRAERRVLPEGLVVVAAAVVGGVSCGIGLV